jgi:hypothetical protein
VTTTTVCTYTYPVSFSISAGIGVTVMLSDKLGLKVEFAPTYAFANPTGYKDEITDANGNTMKTTYTYKNDTPPAQLGVGQVADQPHDSYCSMSVRGGLCFDVL